MPTKNVTFVSRPSSCESEIPSACVVAVLRRRSQERVEMGVFLVDPACCGVLDAWLQRTTEPELPEILGKLFPEEYDEKDAAWGRKFVEGAVEYARRFGLSPHRDYKKAARVFGGIKAGDCPETFSYGNGGKPFYIQPNAHSAAAAQKIVRRLEDRCGKDGYDYLLRQKQEDIVLARIQELMELAVEGHSDELEEELWEMYFNHPSLADAGYALATALGAWDRSSEAVGIFEKVVRQKPDFAEAWFNKALVHQQLGRLTPMVESLRRAIKHADPEENFVKVAHEMIDAVARIGREEYDLDLETYLHAGALYDFAWEMMDEQRLEEALDGFRKAAGLMPRSYQAFGNMGACLVLLERQDEARRMLEKALELNPDYSVARQNLEQLNRVHVGEVPAPGVHPNPTPPPKPEA